MKQEGGREAYRLAFVGLSSMAMFFFFFVYDSPSPMYSALEEVFGGAYASKHSLLYSAYAFPNLLLPLAVSAAVRDPSTAFMACTYALIAAGGVVVWFGAYTQAFGWLVAGRFIIGLGGESFSVVQNKLLVGLFDRSHHGLVLGASMAVARLGSIAAFLSIGSMLGRGVAWCTGLGACLALLGGVLCVVIDRMKPVSEAGLEEGAKADDSVHHLLPHVLGLTIVVACAISPFSSSSSAILQKRLGLDPLLSSRLLAVQEGVSIVFTVVAGLLTDRYGHRLSCIVVGTLLLTSGHALILSSTPLYLLPPVMLGLSSALVGCCWPCIPMLLSPGSLSVGLSILSCGVNLAYTACPWVVSLLSDDAFAFSEFYTVMVSSLAAILSMLIVFINDTHRYHLNSQQKQAKI
ncbi:hypothetical protein NEDG_01416 [Nematocida displodere]|uniref:Lysosomal dipeptide transporter MFSD1 n=1 Tax=Nematocida displodere TaxID=1805483 RepID=A0A177EBL4_9MICR|nr:hypothetical protein NEDG_01416 [Nematocida displodere]